MQHTNAAEFAMGPASARTGWNLGRLALAWGRLRHRSPEAYAAWLRERDITRITAAMLRLSDDELRRIGMSRATLALDIELLAQQAARSQMLGHEALELVAGTDLANSPQLTRAAPPRHAIAAQ